MVFKKKAKRNEDRIVIEEVTDPWDLFEKEVMDSSIESCDQIFEKYEKMGVSFKKFRWKKLPLF